MCDLRLGKEKRREEKRAQRAREREGCVCLEREGITQSRGLKSEKPNKAEYTTPALTGPQS